jgi:hypothetical protein
MASSLPLQRIITPRIQDDQSFLSGMGERSRRTATSLRNGNMTNRRGGEQTKQYHPGVHLKELLTI